MIKEELLHFVWKKGLLSGQLLETVDGTELEVLHPGEENIHAGPDFFNARLRLGPLIWAGNVEVHHAAADWNRHGHQQDPAYDNVILHVVHCFDATVRNSKGRHIQTLVVRPSDTLLERVEEMKKNACCIPCGSSLPQIPEGTLQAWIQRLNSERMEVKQARVSRLLIQHSNNQAQALYRAMASGFGLPINSLPFEMLVSRIPLSFILEIKEDLYDLEALLFGFSGMLNSTKEEETYTGSLQQRYIKLKRELPANPIPEHLWKFLRIRPAAFPTIRLSQFAALIHSDFPLDISSMQHKSISETQHSLQVRASEYWNTHYTFGRISPFSVKRLGLQTANQLLINVLVPFQDHLHIAYGAKHTPAPGKEILSGLQAESNQIIKKWSKFGAPPCNAVESQGIIQLYTNYCLKKRCTDCQIGRELVRKKTYEI